MQVEAGNPHAFGQDAGQPHDQGDVQGAVVEAVVVEVALVIHQRLAVVGVDDDQRVFGQPQLVDAGEEPLDAGVHVGDRPVVLGDDVLSVGDPFGHPRLEVLGKGLKLEHRPHRVDVWVAGILAVKHLVEGRRAANRASGDPCALKRGRMGRRLGQALQFGDGDAVEVLRLGRFAGFVGTPSGVVEVPVKPAGAGIAAEADARRLVAGLPQDLGQGGHLVRQRPLVPERDDIASKSSPSQ